MAFKLITYPIIFLLACGNLCFSPDGFRNVSGQVERHAMSAQGVRSVSADFAACLVEALPDLIEENSTERRQHSGTEAFSSPANCLSFVQLPASITTALTNLHGISICSLRPGATAPLYLIHQVFRI